MYRIDSVKKEFDLIQEHELSREEDAPMSILVNTAVSSVHSILEPAIKRNSDPK